MVNVADRLAVEALPAAVISQFGTVDCVINNAGIIQPFTKLNNLDYSVIESVFNVNFFGTLFMTKAFLPHLLQRPEAHIVNLSSIGGFVPVSGQTIYCASKAAVKLMSEGLSSELLGTNVHVRVVFPGAVATNIPGNSGVDAARNSEGRGKNQAISPARAARTIVLGMERNAPAVFVGRDSMLMDKLHRMNPVLRSTSNSEEDGRPAHNIGDPRLRHWEMKKACLDSLGQVLPMGSIVAIRVRRSLQRPPGGGP